MRKWQRVYKLFLLVTHFIFVRFKNINSKKLCSVKILRGWHASLSSSMNYPGTLLQNFLFVLDR